MPSLAYVYWPNATSSQETLINSVTLGGSICGQILFGFLADRYGRTRLYGIELVIVIVATIVLSLGSSGVGNSISMLGLVVACRFTVGVGIGAEVRTFLTHCIGNILIDSSIPSLLEYVPSRSNFSSAHCAMGNSRFKPV